MHIFFMWIISLPSRKSPKRTKQKVTISASVIGLFRHEVFHKEKSKNEEIRMSVIVAKCGKKSLRNTTESTWIEWEYKLKRSEQQKRRSWNDLLSLNNECTVLIMHDVILLIYYRNSENAAHIQNVSTNLCRALHFFVLECVRVCVCVFHC